MLGLVLRAQFMKAKRRALSVTLESVARDEEIVAFVTAKNFGGFAVPLLREVLETTVGEFDQIFT